MSESPVATGPTGAAAEPSSACYHCGLPVPSGSRFAVSVSGQSRRMCCAGCEAVASAIVQGGLDDYYRHRDSLPDSPREAMPASLMAELALYDLPDVQAGFVKHIETTTVGAMQAREATLILEGITCAACVWLNERHVAALPGVLSVDINYATRRARVRWDEARIHLSDILAAVAAIGYRAYPYDIARSESIARSERRDALWRLFVAGFGMMQVMMYAIPVYLAGEGDMSADIESLMRYASLVLTLPVVLYSAAPFFQRAWRDLRLRRIGMDLPVALGVGSAFAASVWATFMQTGEVYFDSVTMFVFFLLCGRYLEMLARQRAVRGVEELARVVPAVTQKLPNYPRGRDTETIAVGRLQPGDVILVSPGAVIPVDGRVIEGCSEADESLLTGESRPVPKSADSPVVGGSHNHASPLIIEVEKVGEHTRLASIRRLIEQAGAERPQVVQLADRIAARFVAALLVLAVLTAAVWMQLDSARALWVFVSVLVVSCPCALSLATPAALTVATGELSRGGLLVARSHAIESLARATHFVFDKTGTLTLGRMQLEHVHMLRPGVSRADALALAAAVEQGAEHPIARALREAAVSVPTPPVSVILARTGAGVQANAPGGLVRLGQLDYVRELSRADVPNLPPATDSRVFLGDARGMVAAFDLSDSLRPGAQELLAALRRAGVRVSLFSGDNAAAVAALAAKLGIDDARPAMTPEGKRDAIEQLQRHGALVAMVGDGVNDAPVLAQAQVSIAMGSGTELARAQGDFVLLSENLVALARGVEAARRTMGIIRQNLIWSFVYNFGAIPPAMLGWITPWMAGLGMSASSALVVLNALRLQRNALNHGRER